MLSIEWNTAVAVTCELYESNLLQDCDHLKVYINCSLCLEDAETDFQVRSAEISVCKSQQRWRSYTKPET